MKRRFFTEPSDADGPPTGRRPVARPPEPLLTRARDLRATTARVGGLEVLVVSYPAPSGAGPSLSEGERDVVRLALLGHTNRQIAEARGTALRTVVKQLDAAYKKLGVHSRTELAARYPVFPELAGVAAGTSRGISRRA